MAYLTNGTLNYNLTKDAACCELQLAYIEDRNKMDPTYPDPNDNRFTDPTPVFTILNNLLYRDGNSVGRIYNNKTGKIVTIDTITEDSFFYKDTSETAIITLDISVTTISKLTGLKPYQSFCKLTLSDDSVVELEGSGELTSAMVSQYKDTLVSAEIGELCTSIGASAFNGCKSVTSVTIPNSVTSIGGWAFNICSSLTNIAIPNSVTSIGDYAFLSCWSLTNVTISDSITNIGRSIFADCTGLTNVTIGNSVTSIGESAFSSCSNLIEVTIPDSVTSIGLGAFDYCSSLTNVTIPDSVTSIGNTAFYRCRSLTSITSLATTAPTIQSRTFEDVKTNGTLYVPQGSTGYDTWMGTGEYYLGYYNWTKVELLNTNIVVYYDIQDISAPTTIFTNYDSSVKSINIDGKETISEFSQGNVTYQFNATGQHIIQFEFKNTTTVGNSAPLFYNLTTVKRVIIPNTFTVIGSNAFNGCSGLASITIGNGVTSIGNSAFVNCSNLSTITSHIMNAPSVNNGTFHGVKNDGTLYVPKGSSGYETWMNDQGNLGYHNWTMIELS